MSNVNSNTSPTYPKLQKLELAGNIELSFTDEILDRIKFLCRKYPKLEWSGLLFYQIEGSFRDATNMKIKVIDLYLMDIGSKAYTSFDWDKDIVAYQMDNMHLIDCTVGHIHSHNDMSVFFSGTDWSELNDNCPNFNFYLSVIVNNYMDMQAKIAFTAKQTVFSCKDEEGKDFDLALNAPDMNPMMFIYNCEPKLPVQELTVSDTFSNRIVEVEKRLQREEEERKKKAAEAAAKKPVVYTGTGSAGKNSSWGTPSKPTHQDKKSPKRWEQGEMGFWGEEMEHFTNVNSTTPLAESLEEPTQDDLDRWILHDEFTCFLLRGKVVEHDDIEAALNETFKGGVQTVLVDVLENFSSRYDSFFVGKPDYKTPETLMQVLEDVIDGISDFEEISGTEDLINGLRQFGSKLELSFMEDIANSKD